MNECFQSNEKLVAFSFSFELFCVCLKEFCAKKIDLEMLQVELNVQLCFDDSDPVRRLPTDTVRYVYVCTGTCRFLECPLFFNCLFAR